MADAVSRRSTARGRLWVVVRLAGPLAAVLAGVPGRLAGQCPDGSPPPCRGARGAAPPANSVAVLYFESRSSDTNDLALADGLTEEIIGRLSDIERLTVRSRYLVRRYRGAAFDDPAAIGRSLNVTYLVSGTVRRAGGRLRVSAELMRAVGGAQVWGQQFDQPAGDVFSVQEDVAQGVATGIVGRLLPAETRTLAVRPTSSADAYDAYVLGRFYWNKRTAADLVRASHYFQQAIREDSNYAQAWSGLADSYVLFIPQEYDVPGINPDSILTLAEQAARRAIALAPRLGEAYSSLGEILDYTGKSDEAGTAFEQGVALSPLYPTAHQWYSYHLMAVGRWDEAVREMERARELDPLSLVIAVSVVSAYDGADRWSDAEAMAAQCRALDPDHPLTLFFAGLLHDASSRQLQRLPADVRRVALSRGWRVDSLGSDTATAADLERRLALPGSRERAITDIAPRSPTAALALLLAYDGDDAALAYLDRLPVGPGAGDLVDYLLNIVLGARRRADPRFQAVIARRRSRPHH